MKRCQKCSRKSKTPPLNYFYTSLNNLWNIGVYYHFTKINYIVKWWGHDRSKISFSTHKIWYSKKQAMNFITAQGLNPGKRKYSELFVIVDVWGETFTNQLTFSRVELS